MLSGSCCTQFAMLAALAGPAGAAASLFTPVVDLVESLSPIAGLFRECVFEAFTPVRESVHEQMEPEVLDVGFA